MARKLRVEYPGAIYHVMNRGDGREAIFKDDQDRQCFLNPLGETCEKTGWQVQAFCLMPNHFHLVVETPQANLVAGRGFAPATQERSAETALGGPVAAGDAPDAEVDCGAVENGNLETSEPAAV
jgi:REP element-mobilizing transposase RayT